MRLVARMLLASVLTLGGCGFLGNDADPAPTASAVTAFGGTDRAWIEVTIAMDEELLPLLDLVPQHSGSSHVQALAMQVKAFTIAELAELHRLRDAAGLPRDNKHKDMQMPGLVTAEQVTAATKLNGREFDTTVVSTIDDFLEQSAQLADSENRSGVEPETRELAAQAVRTRQAAETTLKKAS